MYIFYGEKQFLEVRCLTVSRPILITRSLPVSWVYQRAWSLRKNGFTAPLFSIKSTCSLTLADAHFVGIPRVIYFGLSGNILSNAIYLFLLDLDFSLSWMILKFNQTQTHLWNKPIYESSSIILSWWNFLCFC